jgi:hypothetical protein
LPCDVCKVPVEIFTHQVRCPTCGKHTPEVISGLLIDILELWNDMVDHNEKEPGRDIQALYDSEINVTITMLWDGGFDFGLCSYMEPLYDDMGQPGWHHVQTAAELGDALHEAALREYPTSAYARSHGVVAGLQLVKK